MSYSLDKNTNTKQQNRTQNTIQNTTRPDTTRDDTTRHDTGQHDTTRHHTTRYDTTRDDTTRHDTTRHHTTRHGRKRRRRKKERSKIRVIPDPKTRDAVSLANAVALPIAVHKTPTPTLDQGAAKGSTLNLYPAEPLWPRVYQNVPVVFSLRIWP